MLSLGSDSDTQDYTCDPKLLQESLAGKFPKFMLPSQTCDRCSNPINLSDKMINTIHFNTGGNVKQSTLGPWEVSEVEESYRPCPKS